jgi:putative nucleotidyltransferase with HDIG domain
VGVLGENNYSSFKINSRIEKVQVACSDLKVGMFVVELDRPWVDTPFLFQGFLISSKEEIDQLGSHCLFVYVDRNQSFVVPRFTHSISSPRNAKLPQPVEPFSKTMEEEFDVATERFDFAMSIANGLFAEFEATGEIDWGRVGKAVKGCVESICANANAMLWLSQIKDKDNYTAEHSLRVAMLSIALGRELGLKKSKLEELGIAAMLHDVGKIRIPKSILNKEGRLGSAEYAVIKAHTMEGRKMLREANNVPESVIDVAFSHHERIDGQGYPQGLRGDAISEFARIVSITDAFDAISSDRCYSGSRTTTEALRILYDCRDTQFDAIMVETLIRLMGIYPAGHIVELSSGEVGIVLSCLPNNRLKPKVLVVRNSDKQLCREKVLDLSQPLEDKNGEPIRVKDLYQDGAFGISLKEYKDNGLSACA